nr:ribonuclease H-like domain-containing protein [Tanacetum cinerariifolium]
MLHKAITGLRQKFEKAKKERDDLKLTLEKFKGSFKNLSRLLDSQQCDKSKTGLGELHAPKPDLVFADEHVVSESVTSLPVVRNKKGNKANAVKASACSIWRLKKKVLDHVSRQNGASMNFKRFIYVDAQGRSKSEKGVIDSGCSRHMTRNMSYLSEYEEIDGGYVTFRGDPKGGKITSKGKISTRNLDFEYVYFVKELKFNHFSVSQMCDKKNSVLFTDTKYVVLSLNFKLLDESQVLLRVPKKNNMYNVDLRNVAPLRGLTFLFAKATLNESNLWHRRLGHINFKTINKLVRGNLVRGLPSKIFENNHTCIRCQKGKQRKASFFARNQTNGNACTKANINAGQAKKKTVSGLQYVLLPLLTSDSQGPKSSEDKVADDRKKSTEVLRKENGVQDLAKEGEATNTNYNYRLNTVSSPINLVTSSFTTVDPGRERAQRNEFESMFRQDKDANGNKIFTPISAAGSTYVYLGGLIPANATILPNADLPTDHLMPDLEDIADTRIFNGVYDEVKGAQVDFNNLELTTVDSTKVKTVNEEVWIRSLIDGKKIIVNVASIRHDLKLQDAEGTTCLPNDTIFEELARMSAKTTAWNKLSSTMSSAFICQATNKKFNFSMYILDNMVLDLEKAKTAQPKEIADFKKRVKKLERKKKSSTSSLKRLYEVDLSARIISSDEAGLEQGRMNEEDLFGVNDFDGDEVIVDVTASENVEQDATVAEKEVNTANDEVVTTTEDVEVTTTAVTLQISKDDVTLSQTLIEIKAAKPRAKEIIKDQITLDEEVARNLKAQMKAEIEEEERIRREKDELNIAVIEEWDDVQATIDVDKQLAEQLRAQEREQLSIKERSNLLAKLMESRQKYFAAKRAEEIRYKTPTKVQQKSLMSTYMKNMEGYKQNDFKGKSFDAIKKMYDKVYKRVNTFVDMNTEIVEERLKKTQAEVNEGSSTRARDEIEQESAKRYRFKKTKPVDDMDNLLFQTLKAMFEHKLKDNIWKSQQGIVKVHNWKSFDLCGVYCVTTQNMVYYLLVEKMYPFTKNILHQMWKDVRLQVDYEVEIAYDLLILFRRQLNEGYIPA